MLGKFYNRDYYYPFFFNLSIERGDEQKKKMPKKRNSRIITKMETKYQLYYLCLPFSPIGILFIKPQDFTIKIKCVCVTTVVARLIHSNLKKIK